MLNVIFSKSQNEYFFHTDVIPKFTCSIENNWFQFLLFYFIYAKCSILIPVFSHKMEKIILHREL